jgi:hypothetical protein
MKQAYIYHIPFLMCVVSVSATVSVYAVQVLPLGRRTSI